MYGKGSLYLLQILRKNESVFEFIDEAGTVRGLIYEFLNILQCFLKFNNFYIVHIRYNSQFEKFLSALLFYVICPFVNDVRLKKYKKRKILLKRGA